jgi:cytochrome P450
LEACHYDNIQDNFDYTMMCFKESMRLEAPIGFSTAHTVTQDVTLAQGTKKELKIEKG